MITGANHVTFAVSDLERSFRFYRDVLGLKPLCRWPQGAYLLAGELWICLSLDTNTRAAPLPEYTHTAFSISEADFETMAAKVRNSGAGVWKENKSEGASLYFLDPDGHKLEIHASDWQRRLETYRAQTPDGMEFFV